MSASETPLFDRSDRTFLADPYPGWARLRDEAPLHVTEGGTYLLTRHGDVMRALRDRASGRAIPERLVRRVAGTGATATAFLASVLNREGADHTRLRRLLLPPFTAKEVAARRERVAALVDDLLDEAPARRIDLVDDLAADLPVLLVLDTLGLPRADCGVVKRRIGELVDASMLFPGSEALARSDEASAFLAGYFREALGHPGGGDGLLCALGRAEAAGELSETELAANAALLLFAGHETTTNAIGNSMLALLEHPGCLEQLRRDPGLLPTAVNELLRYDSPVQATIRWTSAPLDLPSGRIAARRFVEVSLAAANRDPRAFDRPDELLLDRADNPHVAFGAGIHLCLGAALARTALEVVLERLLRRYRTIELDGEPVRLPSLWNRGLLHLPLRVHPH